MSKQNQIKVIVVGDSGVGKSSILLRFVNDEFNEFNDPTLGAAFLSKVHTYGSNQSVRLQVHTNAHSDVGYRRAGEVQVYCSHLLQRLVSGLCR